MHEEAPGYQFELKTQPSEHEDPAHAAEVARWVDGLATRSPAELHTLSLFLADRKTTNPDLLALKEIIDHMIASRKQNS